MSPGLRFNISFKRIGPPRQDWLPRSKLIEKVSGWFGPGRVLTLCAETGYGKSIFASQLLERKGLRWHPIDLRAISQSPISFLRLLKTCLTNLWPSVSIEEGDRLRPDDHIDLDSWLMSSFELMLDELIISASHPGIIVFDSLERIGEDDLRAELIRVLLDRLPEFMGLILISRTPLNHFNLARLKTQGRIMEMDGRELSFDKQELEQLLGDSLPHVKTQRDYVDKIHSLTGGWPVAVDLLIRELKSKKVNIPEAPVSPASLFELLQEEIWKRLSQEDKRTLCILSLCNLCPRDEVLTLLGDLLEEDHIERFKKLPFIEVDEEGRITIPEFFLGFLRGKTHRFLQGEEIRTINLRLGEFYYSSDPVRAFYFFRHGRRLDLSLKILKKHFDSWIKEGKWSVVFSLAEAFDEVYRQKHPELYYFLGLAKIFSGHLLDAIPYLEKARRLLPPRSKMAVISGIRLSEALLVAGRTEEAASLCQELLSSSLPFSALNIEARSFLAISYSQLNDKRAEQLWQQIERLSTSRIFPLGKVYRTYLLAPKAIFFHFDRGEFQRAQEILEGATEILSKNDPMNKLPWVSMFKGTIKREVLEGEQALFYLKEAVEIGARRNRSIYSIATALLALTLAEHGERNEAEYWIKEARRNQRFDETFWTECFCQLSELHVKNITEKEAAERLSYTLSIACDRNNSYLSYQVAYTGLKIRSRFGAAFEKTVLRLLERAEEEAARLGIKYRVAKCLLYKWQLSQENPSLQISVPDEALDQALEYLRDKDLGLLVSRDQLINKPLLYKYCLGRDIKGKFVIGLWMNSHDSNIKELLECYDILPVHTKIMLVDFWKNRRVRAAIPFLKRLKKELPQKQDKAHVQRAMEIIAKSPPEPLKVFTLGRFKVARPYFHITGWKRQRAKEIFKFLLIRHDQPVSTHKLLELFWPNTGYQKAKTSLWSAMSALRSALEPELSPKARSSYLQVQEENYTLQLPAGSFLDFEEFEKTAASAISMSDKGENGALEMLERAKGLYKGDFLPEDIYEQWSTDIRERLKILFQEVLRRIASKYLERRHLSECITTCYSIIEIDPWDEMAYLTLMKALVLQGQEFKALKVFNDCYDILTRELGIEPSKELVEFKDMILQRRA